MEDFRIGRTGNGSIAGFSKNGNHFKVIVALDIDGYEVVTDIYCSCVGSAFGLGDKVEVKIFDKEETQDGDGMLVGGLKLIKAASKATKTTKTTPKTSGRSKPGANEK